MSNVTARTGSPAKSAWASGGTVFAATLMLLIGVFQILMGISAIANDSFLVFRGDYVYTVDTTGWGWIHLGLGVLILITGIGLFTGATWAKIAGVVLVGLSAIDNFLFLPYYPIWSLLLIGLDVFVIWALAYSLRTGGASAEADLMAETGAGYTGSQADQSGQRWATNPTAGYRPNDPEAARRASDMATPARHAQNEPAGTQQDMQSAMAGGSMGTPMGTPPGAPQPGMPQSGGGPGGQMPPTPPDQQ
jgi:hypothetical protein